MTADNGFIYVEVAVGGVQKRNRVMPVADFRPYHQTDCYASLLRFPVELLEWRNSHRNGNGHLTVAGYDGPALATFLPLDFDDEENPGRALVTVRRVLGILHERDGVPVESVRCYYSGAKGFHVEVPSGLFGGFEPSQHIASRLRQLVQLMFPEGNGVLYDHAVYEKLRLWRWPNTRHSKTGLYKVPLTGAEILILTLDQIRMLARAPRTVEYLDSAANVAPPLRKLWQHARQPSRPVSLPVNRNGGTICEGERNSTLTSLAGSLRRSGLSEDAMLAALLVHNAECCVPPLPESEVRRIAASVARYPVDTRRITNGKSTGLMLREVHRARS